MAYALVAWRRDGDEEAVAEAFAEIPAIHFFPGLFLVEEDGVAWDDIKERVRDIVEENPGTEAVIVTPNKGTRVGGWVHNAPTADALKKARDIMNKGGSSAVPVFFATPLVADEEE